MVGAKLIINNSVSKLEGLNDVQFKHLRELLSYRESPTKSHYTGAYGSLVKNLMNKRCEFPSGLLHLVLEYFKLSGDAVNVEDKRRKPCGQKLFRIKL